MSRLLAMIVLIINRLNVFQGRLCKAMEEQTKHSCFGIPNDFKLSDEGLATVVNCALNLLDDNIIDSSYVKNVRQRMRTQASVEQ